MKKAGIVLSLSIIFILMLGCSSKSGCTTRAEGKSNYGTFRIVATSSEVIGQLGVPSIYGKETDFSIKGDYTAVFQKNDGKKTIIKKMDAIEIIQPQDSIIDLPRLSVDGGDIFYFIPQYAGSNDVEIEFFGVTEDGNAFEFMIENNKAQEFKDINSLSHSTAILSTNSKEYAPPVVKDGNITFKAVYNIGEGQNYQIYNVTFGVDLENKVLKFVSKEVFTPGDSNETALNSITVEQLTERNYNYNIKFLPGGAFTVGDLKDTPKIYQDGNDGSSRYAYIVSDKIQPGSAFTSASFKIDGVENFKPGYILLDARASSDNVNWSEFLPGVEINDGEISENEINFYSVPNAKYIEFRLSILCSESSKPVIKKITAQFT